MNYTARQMRIRKNLQVGPDKDQVILLAFAWTDKHTKLRLETFAELCVADVVHGTNKEEWVFWFSQAWTVATNHIHSLGFTCLPSPDGCFGGASRMSFQYFTAREF
jgi:hypothetical protein